MTSEVIAPPPQGPWVDIDLENLRANYALIRDSAPSAQTAAVVKCNAYGLGAGPVARALAQDERCRTFFVVYPEEGAALRAALNDTAPEIYCFAGPARETLALFEQARLTPVLNTPEQATLWTERSGAQLPAALHVDTGMNRIGADLSAVSDIASIKNLRIKMVMSHLACASQPAHAQNNLQRARFIEAAAHFPDAQRSLAASAGSLIGPDYHFDLLRPGIALYGGSPFNEDDARLASVASLRTRIVQIRDLAPGDAVGYDAIFTAAKPTRIATVAIGYGDGYPRTSAPKGAVMINGERASIVGRVSMDFITIDISNLKNDAQANDVVEFYGDSIRLYEAAEATDRIPYDLLTGLGGRVHRRYL